MSLSLIIAITISLLLVALLFLIRFGSRNNVVCDDSTANELPEPIPVLNS